MPLINQNLLASVVFLFRTFDEARQRVRLGGTAFLVGKSIHGSETVLGEMAYVPYLVSNRHVVFEGSSCVAAVNRRDGNPPDIWDIDQEEWIAHPAGDDVAAVCVMGRHDSALHNLVFVPDDKFLTKKLIADCQIGVGEEAFMIGRFVNHQGRHVNEAAARFGCLSMMAQPIWHELFKRDQESFAVEMRSRTGFSGSPVACYRTHATVLTKVPPGTNSFLYLLGVNWGYINENGENSWLNGVVPAWKIVEVLETPQLRKRHELYEAAFHRDHKRQ